MHDKYIYEYILYGFKILTNVEIPILKNQEKDTYMKGVITLKVNLCDESMLIGYKRSGIDYLESENCYIFISPAYAIYKIYYSRMHIDVQIKSIDVLQATLLNIPMSIILTLNNYLLLHASGILTDKGIAAFAGPKGMGKSTLTSMLVKSGFTFFSDDVIAVDFNNTELLCYPSANIIKLCPDAINVLGNDTIELSSVLPEVTDKKYIKPNNFYRYSKTKYNKIASFFVISRNDNSLITVNEMTSEIACKALISQNIVGAKFFDEKLRNLVYKKIKTLSINLNVYRLFVPNDINILKDKIKLIDSLLM